MGSYVSGSFPDDDTSERLRRLSKEVSRIAADLARMSVGSVQSPDEAGDSNGKGSTLSPSTVQQMLNTRRLRHRYFDAELFADPAWDILLELLHAEICQQRVTVSSLSMATSIPSTTAVRWIAVMTDLGLLCRKPDPLDRRRIFVELTAKASGSMRRYFAHAESDVAA